MLLGGENGDGAWAPGYSGSTHMEVLSHNPEPNDQNNPQPEPECTTFVPGPHCNGFALNEAGSFFAGNQPIPWWTSCNAGGPSYTTQFNPITDSPNGAMRKLEYEGRLTKESDNDWFFDCEERHSNWLFPDGIRRELFVRPGWELYGTSPFLVQTFRVRNPTGNPVPGGHAFIIHGWGTTSLVSPPPGKEFRRWLMPSSDAQAQVCTERITPGGQFTFNGQFPICPGEHPMGLVDVWTVSSVNGLQRGRSFVLFHSNPTEPLEHVSTQVCECYAHDSFEIGQGTIAEMQSLAGGSTSVEHRFHVLLAAEACNNHGRAVLKGTEDFVGGSDKIVLRGVVKARPGEVNPANSGARLIISGADGGTLHDIAIPAGWYNGVRGWSTRRAPVGVAIWQYRASTAGAVGGIRRVNYKRTGDEVKFTVRATEGSYYIPLSRMPLRAHLVLGDPPTPERLEAACAEFNLPTCVRSNSGIVCRRRRGQKE